MPTSGKVLLQIKNVPLVQNIGTKVGLFSLEVKEGEMILLEGKNGQGKSYLLNLMAGLIIPARGQVLLLEKDVKVLSEFQRSKWRRSLGLISSTTDTLFPNYSVEDNISLVALALEVEEDRIDHRVKEAMDLCKLNEYARIAVKDLSEGIKKRVLVARALVNRPDLILADELLANLDEKFKSDLIRLFTKLPEFGYTVVLTSTSKLQRNNSKFRIVPLEDCS